MQRDFVPLVPAETVAAVETERTAKLAELDAAIEAARPTKAAPRRRSKAAEKARTTDEGAAELARRGGRAEQAIKTAQKERETFEKQPLPFATAYAVADGKTEGKRKVGNACVQIKGDPERPGRRCRGGSSTVLGGQTLPPDAKGSGRLELADWITDPKNPLTARVMVNRIWQYHFGRGIVADAERLRHAGPAADAPGAARLAGHAGSSRAAGR